MWEELFANCEILDSPWEGYKLVPKPGEDLLNEFEKSHNVKLPASYRQFALKFGAGELAGLFRIAVPLTLTHAFDLDTFNSAYHNDAAWILKEYCSPEHIRHFLFFCEGAGEDFFGWRTDEVMNSAESEYAIYAFRSDVRLKKVAGSFADFVNEYVMKPDPGRGWTPEMKFLPFQVEA